MNKKTKTIVRMIILVLLVASLFPIFVSGLTLVNRSIISNTYFNETNNSYIAEIHLSPINYYNGTGFEPINTTIISNECDFDYCVRKGVYYADFNKTATNVSEIFKFSYNESNLTLIPLSLKYIYSNGSEYVISEVVEVNGTVNKNIITYEDMYGRGIDLEYKYSNGRVKERLILDNLPEGLEDQVSLRLDFIINTSLDIVDSENNLTWDRNSSFVVERIVDFRDENNNSFFYFPRAIAEDSSENFTFLNYTFNKSGDDLTVSILVPYSWLNSGLTYPVFIDPTVTVYASWTNYAQHDWWDDDVDGNNQNTNLYHIASDRRTSGERCTYGMTEFDLDDISINAEVTDTDLYFYLYNTDDSECQGNIDIDLFGYHEDGLPHSLPSDIAALNEDIDFVKNIEAIDFGTLSNLDENDEDTWRHEDAGSGGDSLAQDVVGNNNDGFGVWLSGLCWAIDGVGNDCWASFRGGGSDTEEPYLVVTYILDETPPTTSASATSGGSPYSFGSWTADNIQITLTCTDSGGGAPPSGCASGWPKYCTDSTNSCTPSITYTGPITHTAEGTRYIRYRSQDNNGNIESIKSKTLRIDKTAPITSASATSGGEPYTFGETANTDVEVTLSCSDSSDNSGCDFTKYCTDTLNTCSPNTVYSSPVIISTEGTSYIRYNSTDNVGNQENTQSQTIVIDFLPPGNYPSNVTMYVNGVEVWNHTGPFTTTETTDDFSQELNDALETCTADAEGYCDIPITIHSDSAGNINVSNINIYFNITEYTWDVTGLAELSTYKVRASATDGLLNSSWDESDGDFTIGNITVDTTAPTVEFVNPTPPNGSTQSNNDIYVNVSSSDASDHYVFVDFNKDVVLWMRMDDVNASGDPTDISSYSNNGSLLNGAIINSSGKFGDAAHFDNTDDMIKIPHADNQVLLNKGSWSYWVKLNSYTAADAFISKRDKFNINNAWAMGNRFDPGNCPAQIVFEFSNDGVTNRKFCYNETFIPLNTWTHVAFVFDAEDTGRNVRLYINGTEIPPDKVDNQNASLFQGTSTILIGSTNNGTAGFLNGSIDEVIIFNKTLTAIEISALYNATTTQYANNFTGLSVATHTFTGHAVDVFANRNQTEDRSVTIEPADTISPSISFVPPTPADGTNQTNADIPVNLSTSDNSGDHYAFIDFNNDNVFWMRMDDVNTSGDPTDLSSYSNNGSLQGDSFIDSEGYWGDAAHFDGVGDYIEIPHEESLNIVTEGTISFWMNPIDNTGRDFIITKRQPPGFPDNYNVEIFGNKVEIWTYNGSWFGVTSNSSIDFNTWGHWVVTYDNGEVKMYKNGIEEIGLDCSNTPCFPDSLITNSEPLSIGASNTGTSAFNGTVDEVLIFNRRLSADEVSALYNASANQYSNSFTNLINRVHTFTGYAVDLAANRNQTEERSITISNIDIRDLDVIYTNNTERVFIFIINNTLNSIIPKIVWSLDTGESTKSSQFIITLQGGEDIFVYAYHNYTASGNYTVTATASSDEFTDSESINIVV